MRSLTNALSSLSAAAFLSAALVGCGQPEAPEAMGAQDLEAAYAEFRADVYQEPDSGIFIVDGDTPIETEAELRAFFEQSVGQSLKKKEGVGVRRQGLAVHRAGGVDARWSDTAKLDLRYCVSTTFGANHGKVRDAMAAAATAWSSAARVGFVYDSSQDANCTASNTSVTFDVRPVNSGGAYLARAFFPNSARSSRNVLIDNSAFGSIAPYTVTGILKHELGHALGFRHEHTRPEAGVCFEDNNWRALTSYDAGSVMHYPQCNGSNRADLNLTALDMSGAAALYGAPSCGVLPEGGRLGVGQTLSSCDGRYALVMQGDSNLVLYRAGGVPIWHTNTWNRSAEGAYMQTDGNFVVYNTSHAPLWASGTQGNPGSRLVVQNDGNMVIYRGSVPLWASNTVGK